MGVFAKLLGTVVSFFQVGGPAGPGLANDGGSGNVGAYNPSQSAYVNVRGADPVASHDFVTLGYGNVHYTGGGGGSITAGNFTAVLAEGQDEVFGVVTGLSGAPLKVLCQAVTEQSVTVQSGIKYDCVAYQLNSTGFNWRLSSSEYWPSAGSVSLTVDYLWSLT